MSFFKKILDSLGFKKANADPTHSVGSPTVSTTPQPKPANTAPVTSAPNDAISALDVAQILETKAASHPEKLNWRTSIVDLLKLLGLDSSLAARKELAQELNCPASTQEDSAAMNIWLHREVMKKLAENGGKVPTDLL